MGWKGMGMGMGAWHGQRPSNAEKEIHKATSTGIHHRLAFFFKRRSDPTRALPYSTYESRNTRTDWMLQSTFVARKNAWYGTS